jgi:hypothetical protein
VSAADRTRRYRARQRSGRSVLSIEVDEVNLGELLVRVGAADMMDTDDRIILAGRLQQLLDRVAIAAAEDDRYASRLANLLRGSDD